MSGWDFSIGVVISNRLVSRGKERDGKPKSVVESEGERETETERGDEGAGRVSIADDSVPGGQAPGLKHVPATLLPAPSPPGPSRSSARNTRVSCHAVSLKEGGVGRWSEEGGGARAVEAVQQVSAACCTHAQNSIPRTRGGAAPGTLERSTRGGAGRGGAATGACSGRSVRTAARYSLIVSPG